MKVDNISIKKIENEGNVKAYVSFVIDDCFAVHNSRIINGLNGLFVAMPSHKTAKGFADICHPITQEARSLIEKTIIEKYHNEIENGE